MSTFEATGLALSVPEAPVIPSPRQVVRRRQISPDAGRALEILGHAIEYLTDEFVLAGDTLSPRNGQLEAVQILMSRNRQVYYSCPELPTLTERCLAFWHLPRF